MLLDVALAATVLFAAAWVATRCLRSASADVRRTIWRAAFTGVAALPILLSFDPPQAAAQFVSVAVTPGAVGVATRAAADVPWLLGLWALGCGFVLGRLVVGLAQVHEYGRRAVPGELADFSPAISVPLTWGVLRPQILLPDEARAWSGDTRELVVRHEAAHVASRDWAWQTMARIVTAALWFHPLAWIADRRLRHEAERAADDAVLASGADPAVYADELVRVARSVSSLAATRAAAVGIVEQSSLEHRVRHVLDRATTRGPAGLPIRIAVAMLVGLLSVSAAAMPEGPIPNLGVSSKAPAVQEGPVYNIDEVGLEVPAVLKEVRPVYPAETMRAGIQGEITLETIVETDGVPSEIRVLQPLEESLDRAAVTALSQWRFIPARLKDEPVRARVQVEFTFTVK